MTAPLSPIQREYIRIVMAAATRPRVPPQPGWPTPLGHISLPPVGGSGGTTVVCPNGHQVTIGAQFTNLGIRNSAGGNMKVVCDECGESFDAAPGDHVVVNTGVGGRLQVRQVVRAVRDLKDAVKNAGPGEAHEFLRAVQERRPADLAEIGGLLARWVSEHPQAVAFLMDKGVDLLIALLIFWVGRTSAAPADPPPAPIHIDKVVIHVDHDPTDAELEQLIRDAVAPDQAEPEGQEAPQAGEPHQPGS
jgi:hypothetical protein